MNTTPDPLASYPELLFPAGRSALTPGEIAAKWGVTTEHVFELLAGTSPGLNLTGKGNKTSRQCIRVPLSVYYAQTRERLLGLALAPAPSPDPLETFPELRADAARGALTLTEVAAKWGCTPNHVTELLDTGALATLDMTGVGNRTGRQCIRIPISSYHAATRALLRSDWRPKPKTDPKQLTLF